MNPAASAEAPVGIFDSGVGGLTVARAIIDQLPSENIVYVGDTANGPYGPLSIPQVRAHALAIGGVLAAYLLSGPERKAREARKRKAANPYLTP